MLKEEILERNRKSSKIGEDERDVVIEGQASIIGSGVFAITVFIFIIFNKVKGLATEQLWALFFIPVATGCFYKYYYKRVQKYMVGGILFSLLALIKLINFFNNHM